MGLVPLTERRGVDLNDGRLGERLGAHEFVVAGVVDDVDDTSLARYALGAPGEVAVIETQRAVLFVATARTDRVYALRAETRVRRRTTELELSLLAQLRAFATRCASLMPQVT